MRRVLLLLAASVFLGASYVEAATAVFETTEGVIEITLMDDSAPNACENFAGLINKGYYDGTVFHRVIKDFMVQGGDPTGTGRGGSSIWGGAFEDEVSPAVTFDRPGLVAMANAGPDTNRSQFFITTAKATWLNMRHTIFGEVTSGYDAVERISKTPTDARDRPVAEQKIIRAYMK